MSRTQRDNDLRELRRLALAKKALIPRPCTAKELARIIQTPAYQAIEVEFQRLFAKYGYNPEIFKDRERSAARRVSARKADQASQRAAKRRQKQQGRQDLATTDEDTNDAST